MLLCFYVSVKGCNRDFPLIKPLRSFKLLAGDLRSPAMFCLNMFKQLSNLVPMEEHDGLRDPAMAMRWLGEQIQGERRDTWQLIK